VVLLLAAFQAYLPCSINICNKVFYISPSVCGLLAILFCVSLVRLEVRTLCFIKARKVMLISYCNHGDTLVANIRQ